MDKLDQDYYWNLTSKYIQKAVRKGNYSDEETQKFIKIYEKLTKENAKESYKKAQKISQDRSKEEYIKCKKNQWNSGISIIKFGTMIFTVGICFNLLTSIEHAFLFYIIGFFIMLFGLLEAFDVQC